MRTDGEKTQSASASACQTLGSLVAPPVGQLALNAVKDLVPFLLQAHPVNCSARGAQRILPLVRPRKGRATNRSLGPSATRLLRKPRPSLQLLPPKQDMHWQMRICGGLLINPRLIQKRSLTAERDAVVDAVARTLGPCVIGRNQMQPLETWRPAHPCCSP